MMLKENASKVEEIPDNEYKYLILMCFWFALHTEKKKIIYRLSNLDKIVDKVISNIIRKYNLNIEIENSKSISESNDEDRPCQPKLKLKK